MLIVILNNNIMARKQLLYLQIKQPCGQLWGKKSVYLMWWENNSFQLQCLFKVTSSSSLCCRTHSHYVHPPHGWGRFAERQGGYHLSRTPLLLRFPHLPQELLWCWFLSDSCTTNKTWNSKGEFYLVTWTNLERFKRQILGGKKA